MGNFTSAAHVAKVSPQVRRQMAEFAREALERSGLAAEAVGWSGDAKAKAKAPAAATVLAALVGRLRAVAELGRGVCDGKKLAAAAFERARKNGRRYTLKGRALVGAIGWQLARDVHFVGHDLLNTTAGDLWEQGKSTKKLPKNDALEKVIRSATNAFAELEQGFPGLSAKEVERRGAKALAALLDEADEFLAKLPEQ